jgi:hypothetical protein
MGSRAKVLEDLKACVCDIDMRRSIQRLTINHLIPAPNSQIQPPTEIMTATRNANLKSNRATPLRCFVGRCSFCYLNEPQSILTYSPRKIGIDSGDTRMRST